MYEVVFVGGVRHGQQEIVRELIPYYRAPLIDKRCQFLTLGPSLPLTAPSFSVHDYSLQKWRYKDGRTEWFYYHE